MSKINSEIFNLKCNQMNEIYENVTGEFFKHE